MFRGHCNTGVVIFEWVLLVPVFGVVERSGAKTLSPDCSGRYPDPLARMKPRR